MVVTAGSRGRACRRSVSDVWGKKETELTKICEAACIKASR